MQDLLPIWRPVVGLEDSHEVSSLGAARSTRKGRILRTHVRRGYRQIGLAGRTRAVHQLAAEAFIGTRPPGVVTRHLDGDSLNNAAYNLAWGTQADNGRDAVAHGTHYWAAKVRCKRDHQLVVPNLVPSCLVRGRRGCLACARGYTDARRKGEDIQAAADRHYAEIMVAAVAA